MMARSTDTRTARELIQQLRGRGVTNAEIARELQRDPRMVRKVLNGETPGTNYVQTLRELADTGHANTVPARRRNKAGEVVRVRANRKAGTSSVAPADTGGRYTEAPQGGRYTSTSYGREGVRVHQVSIPKGKKTKGRSEATRDLLGMVRSAARAQSKDTQRRVKITLTFANGRQMEVKDYNASTLLDRMNKQGEKNALGWLASQMSKRYTNLDTAQQSITGVTLNVYPTTCTDNSSRNYKPREGN